MEFVNKSVSYMHFQDLRVGMPFVFVLDRDKKDSAVYVKVGKQEFLDIRNSEVESDESRNSMVVPAYFTKIEYTL